MPTYDYVCADCAHRFELFVPRFDSKAACPECASTRLEKQPTTFGVKAPQDAPAPG